MQDNNEIFKNGFEDIYNESYQAFIQTYFVKAVDSTGRLSNIGGFLDMFFDSLNSVLKVASFVSLNLKLTTVRDIRARVSMCLSVANNLIEGEKIGLYEQEKFSPPKPQNNVETIDDMPDYLAYRLEFSKSPLLVAKSNVDAYKAIIKIMDMEEEIILIELKKGRDLEFSNLKTIEIKSNSSIEIEKDKTKFHNSLSQFIHEINSLELQYIDVSYKESAEQNILSPASIRPYPEKYSDDILNIVVVNEDLRFYEKCIKELANKVYSEIFVMDRHQRNEVITLLKNRLKILQEIPNLIWQFYEGLYTKEDFSQLGSTYPICHLNISDLNAFTVKYFNLVIYNYPDLQTNLWLAKIRTPYGYSHITGRLFDEILKRNKLQCNELELLIDKFEIVPEGNVMNDATNTVEESKKEELTFDNLFPSEEDKEMVMKMLVGLKIINSDGKYLLGSRTGIIRVFIDVMKEEGYLIDIERKPILRIFTPKILGRKVEKIEEPADYKSKKNQILRKLSEFRK